MYSPGGGDRLMESVLATFPQAEIFTVFIDSKKYPQFDSLNKENSKNIHSIVSEQSFSIIFYKIPLTRWLFTRIINVLSPVLYETLDLTKFDLVISISARSAKGIITGIDTCHISIITTPPRFEWDKEEVILENKTGFGLGVISKFISTFFRIWDREAFIRADYVIAISKYIQTKISKYYTADSTVIYPGIKDFWFKPINNSSDPILHSQLSTFNYYYIQSRLYDSKRIDVAIRAAMKAKVNLVIVGEGPTYSKLKRVAGKEFGKTIIFKGFLEDNLSKIYYSNAKAFIFPTVEDFGLVPIEAMACGIPVIAYGIGGNLETVIDDKTGIFFNSEAELVRILQNFDKNRYDKTEIIEHAKKFSEKELIENLRNFVAKKYEEFKK
jgi:glycosyltransferase involved in cell wall biosynthesis